MDGLIDLLDIAPLAPTPPKPSDLTWLELEARIVELNTEAHQIATVWHPDAVGEIVETKRGNVRAAVGPASYQLTSGDIVAL